MVAWARRNRSFQNADKNDNKIEMTYDIKKEIDEILSKQKSINHIYVQLQQL